MANIVGAIGNDFIHVAGDGAPPYPGGTENAGATNADDTISSGNGGVDYIYAGGGIDTVNFYDDFTADDRIDGGANDAKYEDRLILHNAVNIVFNDTTIHDIEAIYLGADVIPSGILLLHALTFADGNVAAGANFRIDASSATVDEDTRIDFSAETDANSIRFVGGAGWDTVIGRASGGRDDIDFGAGGNDSYIGGGLVRFGAGSLTSGDHVDGMGVGAVRISGGFNGNITGAMIVNVARLELGSGSDYYLTISNDVVAAGERMVIDASALGANSLSLQLDPEHDGAYTVLAGAGDDTLLGSDGDDIFILGSHNGQDWGEDTIYGSPGDDYVQSDSVIFNDYLEGGTGFDTLVLADAAGLGNSYSFSVAEGKVDGFERIQLGISVFAPVYYNLTVNDSGLNAGTALQIDGSRVDGWVNVDAETVTISALEVGGGSGDDGMIGGALADSFAGADGNDYAEGGGGGDTLNGGRGGDRLYGDAGADTLNGGIGADAMFGGAGNDTFFVDASGDVTGEGANGGTDVVRASISRTLSANIETLVLIGANAINGSGNGAANTITGNNAANRLSGGASNDVLIGAGGADELRGDGGSDTASYESSTLRVRVNLTTETGFEGHAEGDTYDSIERIVGSAFNDVLTGSSVGNVIVGGAGVDIIDGRGGQDFLNGGGGDDVFLFSTGLGAADMIDDFAVGNDTIRLDNNIFTGLAAGALQASAFRVGAAAADASDRIIYNSATGFLYFDKDGTGAQAAIHFATLDTGLALTAADLAVV